MTAVEYVYLICAIIHIIAACGFIWCAIGSFILEGISAFLEFICPSYRPKPPKTEYIIRISVRDSDSISDLKRNGQFGETDIPTNTLEGFDSKR